MRTTSAIRIPNNCIGKSVWGRNPQCPGNKQRHFDAEDAEENLCALCVLCVKCRCFCFIRAALLLNPTHPRLHVFPMPFVLVPCVWRAETQGVTASEKRNVRGAPGAMLLFPCDVG